METLEKVRLEMGIGKPNNALQVGRIIHLALLFGFRVEQLDHYPYALSIYDEAKKEYPESHIHEVSVKIISKRLQRA
jgi:hypothetical protein